METKKIKTFKGRVVSDRMQKTRVVRIEKYIKIPKYGKYLRRSKKFKAHDENNEYKIGDKVIIQETRPYSREKSWKIIKKI